MDTRPRVLVVEDDNVMRDTLIDFLRREGFRADGASTAAEAVAATSICTYHVALIDIMLAGDDQCNRDGVDVVSYLQWLQEGTQSLVLSGQGDTELVRDLLRKHGAVDYLNKADLQIASLARKIKALVNIKHSLSQTNWEPPTFGLTRALSERLSVNQCMRFLEFTGGLDSLSSSLAAACKHLVPLLKELDGAIADARAPTVFGGRFWSKGQSSAVEILIYGRNTTPEALDSGWDFCHRTAIYKRTKGGLSIVVFECPDVPRERFEPLSRQQ